jgi:hypothetical protein
MLTTLFGDDVCDPLQWTRGANRASRSGHQHAPTCFGRLRDGIKGPMRCDRIIKAGRSTRAMAQILCHQSVKPSDIAGGNGTFKAKLG